MSTLSRRLNLRYFVLSLVIAFLAAGCATSTVPVGKFDLLSDSCQKILKGTTETYTRIMKMERRYYVATAAISTKKKDILAIDLKTFSPTNSIIPETKLSKELCFREAALKVLVRYVLALQILAKHDFAGDINKVMEKLKGSLSSLIDVANEKFKFSDPNRLAIARETSKLLVRLVNWIARTYVNAKRMEILREAMDGAQKHIKALVKLIATDNKRTVYRLVRRMVQQGTINNINMRRLRPARGTWKRLQFDSMVAKIIHESIEIQNALIQLAKAINLVPRAHAEIRKMLDKQPTRNADKPTKLDENTTKPKFTSLQQLVREVQPIDNFYRTIK